MQTVMVARVLVCGGRDFNDKEWVYKYLDGYSSGFWSVTIIQGGARGADALAKAWSKDRDFPMEEYKADWEKFGKGAGYRRNKQMLIEGKPTVVIAFPGGRGTADMVKQAKAANIPVLELGAVGGH